MTEIVKELRDDRLVAHKKLRFRAADLIEELIACFDLLNDGYHSDGVQGCEKCMAVKRVKALRAK